MTSSMDDTPINQALEAFADGELDAQQHLSVLEQMAADPSVTRTVIHQQQLRHAVDRVIRQNTPAAPEALRKKIQQLAAETPAAATEATVEPNPGVRNTRAGLRYWVPLVAAALLFVSAVVLMDNDTPADHPVTKDRYASFVHRHLNCNRTLSQLRNRKLFSQDLKRLPGALTRFLGGPLGTELDLSSVGYAFYAVGECTVPGKNSVHLIYRAKADPTGQDALSLWIRRHDGSPDIEANRPYVQTGGDMSNPLLLWRHGEMIYYLVGHSLGRVELAATVLGVAS